MKEKICLRRDELLRKVKMPLLRRDEVGPHTIDSIALRKILGRDEEDWTSKFDLVVKLEQLREESRVALERVARDFQEGRLPFGGFRLH